MRGSRYVRPDGYVAVKVGVRQWELEHRLVMQQHLGRALRTDEHVHHKNGDRQDNRLANLAVLAATDHVALHGADWRDRRVNQVTVNCDHCGQPYTRKASRAAASRYCSQRCYHEARRRHA